MGTCLSSTSGKRLAPAFARPSSRVCHFFSVTTDWGPFPRTSAAQMEIEDGIAGAASQGEEKDGVSDAEFEGEGDYEEGFFSDKWLQGLRERGDVGQRETYT